MISETENLNLYEKLKVTLSTDLFVKVCKLGVVHIAAIVKLFPTRMITIKQSSTPRNNHPWYVTEWETSEFSNDKFVPKSSS